MVTATSQVNQGYENRVLPINNEISEKYYTHMEKLDSTEIIAVYKDENNKENYKAYQTALSMLKYSKSRLNSIKIEEQIHNSVKEGSYIENIPRIEYIAVGNSEEEGKSVMNENDYLQKYIDKMDVDRREQEKRLSESMKLMEQRITEERRLSEERMESKFNKIIDALEKTNITTQNAVKEIETKFDENRKEIEVKLNENNKFMRNMQITTILGIGAMVLAVASIAASVFFGIKTFYTP